MPGRVSPAVVLLACAAPFAAAAAPGAPLGCQVASLTYTNDEVQAIPSGPAVITSTLSLTGQGGRILDVDVFTNIHHSQPGDLDITLTSPNGTVVTLTTDNGGANADAFAGTWWDDQADPGGAVPYTSNDGLVTDNTFAALPIGPVAPEEPLGAFTGEPVVGIWTLTISDDQAGDAGSLDGWGLTIRTIPRRVGGVSNWVSQTDVPIPSGPGVVSSTIDVLPGSAPVRLSQARVTAHLTHSSSADLDITLTSPAGKVVTLTSDNGGAFDNVFDGTTWRDDADPGQPLPYASNPGLTTDRVYANLVAALELAPEEPLALLDGDDPSGTWTLTISDDFPGNGGLLDGWELAYSSTFTCLTKGNLNADGAQDLVLRHSPDNAHAVWTMNGVARQSEQTITPALAAAQRVVGTGQFLFANVGADLVVQDQDTNAIEFWDLDVLTFGRIGLPFGLTGAVPLAPPWKLSAVADFDHDGNDDLVWRNQDTQKLVIWKLGGDGPTTRFTGTIVPNPDQAVHANWAIVATLDFDHDNNTDFLWYNATSGKIVVWFMDPDVVRVSGTFTSPDSAGNNNWQVVASGDYGPTPGVLGVSDTVPDIVWRNRDSGKLVSGSWTAARRRPRGSRACSRTRTARRTRSSGPSSVRAEPRRVSALTARRAQSALQPVPAVARAVPRGGSSMLPRPPRWSCLPLLALFAATSLQADVVPGQLPQVSFQPGGLAYWERPYFANALMAGGEWYANNAVVPHWNVAPFDANGYPSALPGGQTLTALIDGLNLGYQQRPSSWPDLRAIFRGHWVLTWQGHADVRLEGGGAVFVPGESSGAATGNLLNGRRVYVAADPPGVVRVYSIVAPLTDVKAWLPDPANPQHASLENQLFHPAFLQRLSEAPWGLVRFMDWGSTNASPQQDWSDRRPPRHIFATGVLNPRAPATGFSGNRITGAPYEHMVALANASQRDLWVCVPHLATDDYVTKLAQLLRYGSDGTNPYAGPQANPVYPPLDAARKVYVEFSNEIWANGDAFAQGDWAQAQANGLGLSKAQFNARRFSQVFRLFQQVFGGPKRIVRVASVFTAGQFYTEPFLQELAAYGPTLVPPVEPDVIAGTTYFGNGIQDWAETRAVLQRFGADPWFYGPLDWDSGGGVLRPLSVPYTDAYWTSPRLEQHLQATLAEWRRRMLSGSAAQGGGPDATGFGGGFDIYLRQLAQTVFPTPKPLIAYEGGPSIYTYYIDGGDVRDDGVTTFMEALNRHAGIKDLYAIHLNMAKSKGLRTHAAFVDTSVWGKWGQWGHLEHLQQPLAQAPKQAFLLDWIAEMAGVRHIDDALGQVPEFSTAPNLAPALYGVPYQADLHTAGGDSARVAKLVGASLVPGLSAAPLPGDPTTLRVSGTPQTFGPNYVYARVVDEGGDPAWRVFNFYAAGGPGTLFESDFRGADPGLHTPWAAYYVNTGWLNAYTGWERGPGAVGQAGNDALTYSVNAPAVESTLAQAVTNGDYLGITILPAAKYGLNLRRAELRFTVGRLDYHAPRRYAVFTSIGGFASGQEIFTTPHFSEQNEPREFVVGLPDTAAYAGVKAAVQIRIYGFAAQYSGHRTSLQAARLALRVP